ncbi:MAG: hypothetical protein QM621_08200 [Aeromicrobium sp.]|uniref:hypothetical protein n=1 Tax=Aeromicrobium sp. TaxID=1871063 RepID=UPI0039E2522E
MNVKAVAQREGKWWAIEIPDVNDGGVFTQARTYSEVEAMAADAVATVYDIDPAEVEVRVELLVPPEVRAHMDEAARLREQAADANRRSAEEARVAARELRARGLSLRDIGAVLGVSFQRAGQLVKDAA